MATYRCKSCGSVYVSPQQGATFFHACPAEKVVDFTTGARVPWPNHRDENIVQERPGGPVHMKALGAGREKLSDDDLVSGIRPDQVAALLARPAIGPSPLPEEDLNKGRQDVGPSLGS